MPEMNLRQIMCDIGLYSQHLLPQYNLRPYQLEPARAIVNAIEAGQGAKFALVFSRQSGKDELVAQLLAYLLTKNQRRGGQIIMAAPTARQVAISRQRLLDRLQNSYTRGKAATREGYIVKLGRAEARFLSAAPSANVRGETASLLLLANEAQDILPARWDAVFDPMAASTNATTLFMGTPWTSATLLAREMRHLRETNPANLFLVDWQTVAAHNPAYGQRVQQRITQFGSDHPFIQTEYFLHEIGQNGLMFNATRQEAMRGSHLRQQDPLPGRVYALLVDVAGEDEAVTQLDEPSPRRDSTVASLIEIEQAERPSVAGQIYKLVQRFSWRGDKHTNLYEQLANIYTRWNCRLCIVDATGVGAGLASFLSRRLGERAVIPFIFSAKSKSDLGWNFLALVDAGRFQHYADDGAEDTALFWQQVRACDYQVRPGFYHHLRWSVPDPRLHDDALISAALTALLDEHDFKPRAARIVLSGAKL